MKFVLVEKEDSNKKIKYLIWAYIFLLIFEGALRKWVVPALSTPILVIRDPIAFIILMSAIQNKVLKFNVTIYFLVITGGVAFFCALLFGHGSIVVALFGLRAFLLHFPLMFVIGAVFKKADVLKVGRVLMVLLMPMIILTIVQFYSPQSSFVNRGVGDDIEGAGFGGAMGYFRAPGTFSFTNGLASFYGLASAFLFYFIYHSKIINQFLLKGGLLATLLSIPFTISRTVLFQNVLCFAFSIVIIAKRPSYLKNLLLGVILVLCFILIFRENPIILTATEAFSSRFEDASVSEGGLKGSLIDRMFLTLWEALANSVDIDFFGRGLGANSNIGRKLLTERDDVGLSDYEWARTISELGPLLGISFIIIRISILIKLVRLAIQKFSKNEFLPWMLLSFGFMQILQGQIAQPTSLGFIVLITGLIIASMNDDTFKIKGSRNIII